MTLPYPVSVATEADDEGTLDEVTAPLSSPAQAVHEKAFAKIHFNEGETPAAPIDEYKAMLKEMRSTFRGGKTRDLAWRKHQLNQLIKLCLENIDAIVEAMGIDLGGPKLRSVFEMGFVEQARYALKNLDRWARDEPVAFGSPWGRNVVRREPKGVVLCISPWNFPINLALDPLVAILAAGNCCVLKPSEMASASCALLTRLVPRYMDPDAVRIITGGAPEVTALLELKWDHIMYTGNGSVGRVVMAAAAKHLTPVTLELGGKSPVIVDKSAKIDLAAKRIAQGKWISNAGQVCIAPDYVLVDKEVEAPLLDALAREANEMLGSDKQAHGSGAPPNGELEYAYGKIINERHVERLASLLDACGGKAVLGSARDIDAKQRYVPPMIISRPRPDAELLSQEIFGPILPVCPVASIDEAIERARFICETPLALYIFSENRATAERVLRATTSGGAAVNTTMEHVLTAQMPFGGVGESGTGAYHGRFGFDEFSHKRSILYRSTVVPMLMLPPVVRRGLVPSWLYALALRMQVTGFLPPALKATLAALVAAVVAAACSLLLRA